MPNAIFISYRRDDTEGEAGRLFDDLSRAFGAENVFMDVAGIRPGVDFRRAIEDNVAHCGVLLAIVGPTWLNIANAAGQRRLNDPNDFVALEIASALKREVPVIPVLVHGAHMPHAVDLPASLESFAYRNSVELSHARWNSDVQLLIDALAAYVNPEPQAAHEPVHATIPAQLPEPHAPSPSASPIPRKRSKRPLIIGAVVVLLLVICLGLYLIGGDPQPPAAAALEGNWSDPSPRSGNSLASLNISLSKDSVFIHAFGTCQPTACDWGTQPATFTAPTATATFTFPAQPGTSDESRTATVTVFRAGDGLDVTVHNTFQDQDDSRKNIVHRVFATAQ